MKLIRNPLRLAEAATQAATILTAVLAPYRSFALDPQLVVVWGGVLAGLTVAVYALHAVTFDHFRVTGNDRSPDATGPSRRSAETPGTGIATVGAAPRS